MTVYERGFLLLSCRLGDPMRKVLTPAQLRTLTLCVSNMEKPTADRDLTVEDLAAIGCKRLLAERTVELLSQEKLLDYYLQDAKGCGCKPVTRVSADYPAAFRDRLGPEAPGSVWYLGDIELLQGPMIALVGSRELSKDNEAFAREVGKQAARQGYTLVSGNANGADRVAQNACLAEGGRVVSIVADALNSHKRRDRVLYLSEEGFDLPFTAQRALQRNRLIHSLGQAALVAQCRLEKGGTWSGTTDNLRKNYSPVYCFEDGTAAVKELQQRGATPITTEALQDLSALCQREISFL